MDTLEVARLQAGAALLALIADVTQNGGLGSDITKLDAATHALAHHARLVTHAHLRQAAESVLIDRLAEDRSSKSPNPGTMDPPP